MMLALLAHAASAAATLTAPQPNLVPQYVAGDAFVFSDGRVERVVKPGSTKVTWRGLSGASYQRSPNFVVPVLQWRNGRGTGRREVRGNPDALWPLGKGKSARFRVITETKANPQARSKRSVSLWVCKAGKSRVFTVAAGTYEAFPIKCDRYSSTTMRLLEQREWDYAPEIGHYIRRVTINYLQGTTRSSELVAALSGPAATKARLASLARTAKQLNIGRKN